MTKRTHKTETELLLPGTEQLDEKSREELVFALKLRQIQFLIQKGHLAVADRDLADLLEPAPEHPAAREDAAKTGIALMRHYQNTKQDAETLEFFRRSLILQNNAAARWLAGFACKRLSKTPEAKEHLAKSIALDSAKPEPYLALGEILETEKPDEAVRLYCRYHDRFYSPAGTKVFTKKIRALLKSGKGAVDFKKIRIACIGNFTLQPLQPHLEAACFKAGIDPEIFFGGYDLYIQEITDPQSDLYKFKPRLTLLFLDSHTLLPELYENFHEIPPPQRLALAEGKMSHLAGLMNKFLSGCDSALVAGSFPLPRNYHMGIYDAREPAGEQEILRKMNDMLSSQARIFTDRFYVLDTEKVLAGCGKSPTASEKMRYLAKMTIPEGAMSALAREIMRHVRPTLGMTKKCLVLDLDNTLWGGILGEDGIEGIKLGLEPPGNAFREFQQAIKCLQHRGILLAVNSKNDLDLVKEAFEKHPDMILKLDDFACIRANWQDKAQNLREIARELNIGLDSFVYMDDNPAERLLIEQEIPEILTVKMPEDFSDYAQTLLDLDAFEVLRLTEEDRNRKSLYQAEVKRKDLKTQITDIHQYLESLDIVAEVFPADAFAIPRVAQLTQRTNQFNLTTRRYQEIDVRNFAQSQNHRVYYVKSADRFGDHGIIGAGILRIDKNRWEIDTFLLSCRVVGRGIEQAFLHFICMEAKADKAGKLIGRYLPTRKNRMVENFYTHENFDIVSKTESETVYELDIEKKTVALPSHIDLRTLHGS